MVGSVYHRNNRNRRTDAPGCRLAVYPEQKYGKTPVQQVARKNKELHTTLMLLLRLGNASRVWATSFDPSGR